MAEMFSGGSFARRRAGSTRGARVSSVAAGLVLAALSQSSLASETATLLVAALDSAADYCSDLYPVNRNQYIAFVDGILSNASKAEIEGIRHSDDYEKAKKSDLAQLRTHPNSTGLCSGSKSPS